MRRVTLSAADLADLRAVLAGSTGEATHKLYRAATDDERAFYRAILARNERLARLVAGPVAVDFEQDDDDDVSDQ